jgi:hypothetical protein
MFLGDSTLVIDARKIDRNSIDEGVIPGIGTGFILRVYIPANVFCRVHFNCSQRIELCGRRIEQQAGDRCARFAWFGVSISGSA